jgi:hypothetical protein
MASGLACVIGYYPTDVFGEAASSPDGLIEVDFLRGRIVRGNPSADLKAAAALFAEAFPAFCKKNGAEAGDFETLSAVFHGTGLDSQVSLVVADRPGRRSVTQYTGAPLKRLRIRDNDGLVRRVPREMS